MAEVFIAFAEAVELRDLMAGRKIPPGVRIRTWNRLLNPNGGEPSIAVLSASGFRALVEAEPRVLEVLGFSGV